MLKILVGPALLGAVSAVTLFGQGLYNPIAVSIASIARVTRRTSNRAAGVASGVASGAAPRIPVLQGTTTIIVRARDSKGASNWVAVVAVHP
jgi:hypothetical protein